MNQISLSADQPIWIYMTASHKRDARNLVRHLLETRLIACANFTEQWSSMYRWKDKVVEERETIIIAKSVHGHFEEIQAKVSVFLGYECPCILALPIVNGYPAYLDWLQKMISEEPAS